VTAKGNTEGPAAPAPIFSIKNGRPDLPKRTTAKDLDIRPMFFGPREKCLDEKRNPCFSGPFALG